MKTFRDIQMASLMHKMMQIRSVSRSMVEGALGFPPPPGSVQYFHFRAVFGKKSRQISLLPQTQGLAPLPPPILGNPGVATVF